MGINFEYSGQGGPYIALAGVAFLALLAEVRRRKRFRLIADSPLLPKIWLPQSLIEKRSRIDLFLWLAIGGLLTLALMRPEWGYVWRDTKRRGVDIVVAVDVSESMMANDVLPNRLSRARYKIRDLLEHLKGDRVALIAFAGTAFIESPLTVDYGTFKLFLDSLSPELIPIQGTNIRGALEKSLEALGYQDLENPPPPSAVSKSQAILLITDGEDFEGDFKDLGEFAAAQGVQIYIIGVGTKEGGPIPVGKGFKRDREGKMVVTRLNEIKLIELAQKTGGIYVQSNGSDDDITTIYDQGIRTFLESHEIEGGRRRLWNERFQVPLLFAVILLLLGPWGGVSRALSVRNFRFINPLRIKRKDHDEKPSNAEIRIAEDKSPEISRPNASLMLLLLTAAASIFLQPFPAYARDSDSAGYEGKQELVAGDFKRAKQSFEEAAAAEGGSDPRVLLGLGESNYRLGMFKASAETFKKAAEAAADREKAGDPKAAGLRAAADYNLGNALVQLGDYKGAISSYEAAQKIKSGDPEVADNLSYVRRLMAKKDKPQPKPENQKKEQDNNKEKNQPKTDQKNPDQKNDPNKQNPEDQKKPDDEAQNQQNDQQEKQDQEQQKDQKKADEEEKQNTGKKDSDQNKADEESSNQKNDQKKPGDQEKQNQQQKDQEQKKNEKESAGSKQDQDQKESGKKDKQQQEQEELSENQKKDSDQEKDGSQKKDQQQKDQPSEKNAAENESEKQKDSGGENKDSAPSKPSSGDGASGDQKKQPTPGDGSEQSDQSAGNESDPGRKSSEKSGDSSPKAGSGEQKKDSDSAGSESQGSKGSDPQTGKNGADGKTETQQRGENKGRAGSGDQQGGENGTSGDGKAGPTPGRGEKSAGFRKGDGSDQAGETENDPKAGEGPAQPDSSDPARMTQKGSKTENNGPHLNEDKYASPLGADEDQIGGEGSQDTLAEKEGPGEHRGITESPSETDGAGTAKNGSGKAGVESFLENVGEERGLYLKYREKKGLQQLRSEGRSVPDKDW